jgi:hypothetical protein
MKMEQIECSETSAYKIQTPGNHPEENIQHFLPSLQNFRMLDIVSLCSLTAVFGSFTCHAIHFLAVCQLN